MASHQQRHESLLDTWKAAYDEQRPEEGYFVRDGALSEYWDAPVRICAVLKEPGEDPRELSEKRRYDDLIQVFEAAFSQKKLNGAGARLALWMAGFFGHLDQFGGHTPDRRELVGSIGPQLAIVNLKKTCGGARSSKTEILGRASADREFIRQQLELLEPDLILSCGRPDVWGSLMWLYQLDWNSAPQIDTTWAEQDGTVVLDLIHPSARGRHPKRQFEDLVDLGDLIRTQLPADSIT